MTGPAQRREPGAVNPLTRFVTRHPVGAFSVTAFGLGWPLPFVRSTTSFASTAVGLAFTWGALLGSALAVLAVVAPFFRYLLGETLQAARAARRRSGESPLSARRSCS